MAEPDHDCFRAEVRQFLAANLTPEMAERVQAGYYLSKAELQAWQAALNARGWVAPNWPVAHGGTGWTEMQKYIFEDECARAGAPILLMMGINQVGSMLINFGTPAQQARFLPPILAGTEYWCQGFSEPQSGSDLASLRCAARLEGEHYIVNGTKLWTTAAHWSDWCLLLVRTDASGAKQEGITVLLMDMTLPGITIRPIIGLDGMHSLNQLFLDDVRIPVSMRVGAEGSGWQQMRVVLGGERLSAAGIWKCKAHFERLGAIARKVTRAGRRLIDEPRFRDRMAWVDLRLQALEAILLGIINDPKAYSTVQAQVLKLRGTQLQQELLFLMSEAAGYYGLPFIPEVLRAGWGEEVPIGPDFAAPASPFYLFWRKATISGGSSEVMRNQIAHTILAR